MRGVSLSMLVPILCSAGCYSFQPLEIADLEPDMEVRARLSRTHAEELRELFPLNGSLIQGTVLEADETRLLLLAPVGNATRRGEVQTLNQRLEIAQQDLLEIELRTLDRWKTGALSAAGAFALGYILIETLSGGGSGNTPGGGTGGPQDSWIPFPIPIPLIGG